MILNLVIHNIASIVSAIIAVGVAFFLFINGKRQIANITLAMGFITTAIFYVSHVIGVNISDPNLSRWVLMANLVILFTGAFNYHSVLALIGKDKDHQILLSCVYASAFIISIFFLVFPELFLVPSVPKMYFPNYYEPGVLNWVRLVYLFVILVPVSIYMLYKEYINSTSLPRKKQLKYFIMTMIVGYGVGFIPNFLVYDIPVDPLWGIFFIVVCAIPLTYGAVKYQLFSVQVIAKQAFFYSIAVAAVGSFITLLNYSSIWVSEIYPNFPTWTLALVSAMFAVSASVIVWRGLRKSDLLKAEFITTVTHKFRTPLTYIKWASENLQNPELSAEDRKTQIEYIRSANEKLVELTNILTTASDVEGSKEFGYTVKAGNLSKIVEGVASSIQDQLKIRNLTIKKDIKPDVMAKFDEHRIKFVTQVLLENALHYSKPGGIISVDVDIIGGEARCSVKDEGLGMTADQISLLFSKFFRSEEARKLDTEGMGMGLFISDHIIGQHNGRIWAESPGPDKGSTFHFSLPLAK